MPELQATNKLNELPRRKTTRFKRSILLVDDDRISIDSMSRWFEKEGYETNPTFHPLHGLILAAEQAFDAAVIDINLPDLDGIEFLKELVDLKKFPVIVLTSDKDPSVVRKAIELGAADCYIKPTNMDDLQESVERAVSQF